ncbi:MAG TPA: hypothetical protein VGD71_09150, partial [Kribbella sp.]
SRRRGAGQRGPPLLRRRRAHPARPRGIAALPALFSVLDISEVARSSGHVLADTAAVHFQLGEQLLLDWLRQRILELPREDHWQALARGALRDTLYEVTGCRPAQSSRPHYPLYAVSGQTTGTEVPDPVRSL